MRALGCFSKRKEVRMWRQAALGTNFCASLSYVALFFGLRERG